MTRQAEIVIIGGGMWGCSVAYHLARRGRRDIVLLEQAEIAGQTTGQAAGLIGQVRTSETAMRGAMYGIAFWAKAKDELGYDPRFRPSGSLKLALTPARKRDLETQARQARGVGLEVDFISLREARDRVPGLDLRGVRAVMAIPSDGWVDPGEAARALAHGARALGVKIEPGVRVTGILGSGGRVTGVRTDHGEIRCEVVVIAAGPWADAVARGAGLRLPIIPVRHQSGITAPVPGVTEAMPVLRIPDLGAYVRPEEGGYLFGVFERNPRSFQIERFRPGFRMRDLPANRRALARGAERLGGVLPALPAAGLARERAGLPGFTPDGDHILDEAPGVRGCYVVAGCSATGIMDGAAIGLLAAELILDGKASLDTAGMRLGRFGRRYRTRQEIRRRCESVYRNYYAIAKGRL